MRRLHLPLLILLAAVEGLGHTGESLKPHDLWSAWTFDPGIVLPLALTGILYARGARLSRGTSFRELACFWSGWVFLALSLLSPLHPLGEALFSAHMAQHEILILVAAPLLVLSRPSVAILWGLPLQWRRTLGRWTRSTPVQTISRSLTQPWMAWWIHAAALWLWHAPQLFQATLTNEWIHAAQHISFLASALLFWWSLLYARGRHSYGASVLYVFTTAVHTSILGALLTLAGTVWYPAYTSSASNWGLTPLEDQQLGGLIMWIPAGGIYFCAGLGLFAMWLCESDVIVIGRGYAE
jgi:putative membrane protein